MGSDTRCQICGGMTKRIRAASPRPDRIQTNCFPARKSKSKMEDGFADWVDA